MTIPSLSNNIWRGNVDVKPLLYQSDPSNTDPEDIVTCSDYLVGYQMKGAQTLAIEKKNMKDLVMNMEDMYGNKEGVFSAARKLLIMPRLTELYPNRKPCVCWHSFHWFCVQRRLNLCPCLLPDEYAIR
jgi:hypothetical protein